MTKFLWNQSVDPQEPPAQIEIERGDWEDSSRGGRRVPYKVYAPAGQGGGRFPVILWSHGLGGSREGGGVHFPLYCVSWLYCRAYSARGNG
jgi:hypothetical protein